MELGHGFLLRIDAQNYKAVERCLASGSDNLFQAGLDLPWAIAEGPWAEVNGQSLLSSCRERGTKVLIDTEAWRYREPATFSVPKLIDVSHAPRSPLDELTPQFHAFVAQNPNAQRVLGADAYVIPGVVPRGPHDEINDLIEHAVGIAEESDRPARRDRAGNGRGAPVPGRRSTAPMRRQPEHPPDHRGGHSMNDNDVSDRVPQSVSGVHMHTPVEEILARARARRRRHCRGWRGRERRRASR